jgi:predicted Zn-dependent protease
MRRTIDAPALALPWLLCLTACSTVQETGRTQWVFFDDAEMNQLGAQAYEEATKEYRIIRGTPEAQMVERVGQKIAQASGRSYQWEFRLLDAPDVVNAFCLPGGKVAVYTGILKVTQNEDGLACVMGHEVAHATSRHGAERMSQTTVAQGGLSVAGLAAGWAGLGDSTQDQIVTALGGVAQVGFLLPFSRQHESEADEIGLLFMIRAGFDPEEAPLLWERMAKLGGGGGKIAEWFSTHPDPGSRAARLRELIPAMKQRVAKERAQGQQPR